MSYKEKFITVFNDQKKRYDDKLRRCSENGLPKNPIRLYTLTSANLEVLAVGEYVLNKDIIRMKNYFYNAAIAQEKAIVYYDTHDEVKPGGFLSMLSYRGLFFAIISDSDELQIRYANLMGGRGDLDKYDTDNFTYNWGYALKYVVLNNDAMAMKYLEKMNDSKREHFIRCLQAILVKNENDVNDSLCEILKKSKASLNNKNGVQELLCISAIALAKLANSRGMLVDIDDAIAPKEVIKKTQLNYHVVELIKLFI